jgi:hypothetical protein
MTIGTPNRRFAVIRKHPDTGEPCILESEISGAAEIARMLAEKTNRLCGPNWRDDWPITGIKPVDVVITLV